MTVVLTAMNRFLNEDDGLQVSNVHACMHAGQILVIIPPPF